MNMLILYWIRHNVYNSIQYHLKMYSFLLLNNLFVENYSEIIWKQSWNVFDVVYYIISWSVIIPWAFSAYFVFDVGKNCFGLGKDIYILFGPLLTLILATMALSFVCIFNFEVCNNWFFYFCIFGTSSLCVWSLGSPNLW